MTESRAWQDSESGNDPSSTGIESVISDDIKTGVDAPAAQTTADNRELQSLMAEDKIDATPSLTRAHVNVDELTKRDQVVRGASTSKEVPPEIRILGDYELLREISHGGQGVVYEARKRTLDLPVAVKVLHFSGMLSTAMLQRFRLEARAASQLRHPNILRVHDIGFERGTHFYAMDYVEGGTVTDMIRNLARQRKQRADASTKVSRSNSANASDAKQATTVNGSTSFNVSNLSDHRQYYRFVAKLGLQVADALNFSHQHGVVHRDIKPSNLLLDTSGCVYVSDFGLARFDGQQELTKPGEFLGTLRYMSPEQGYANRVTLDGRTDIFSLGATLYEMLTLQPAFQGESKAEILHNVAFRELVQAKQIDRGIPNDLNTIVMKCLEKKPDDRYQDARQLRDDLEAWLDHRRVIATPPTTAKRVGRWIMKHRGISGTIGLCVVTAIAMGFSALAFALQAEKEQVGRYAKLLRQSESMRLAANSALQLPQNPGLAVALAAKGVDVQRSLEAESALRAALDENHERLVLRDHSGAVGQASFSPHGKFIVTTGASIDFSRSKQPARLYDASTGELIRTLQADDLITSAAFGPHGDRLLTASTPNNANAREAEELAKHPPVLWNVERGDQIGVLRDAYLLKAHPACFSIVSGVTQIVAPSLNNAACIYNAAGEKIRSLEGHQASITFAAFNAQGDKVVTIAEDNTVRIWNSSTGEQLKVLDYWEQFAPSDFHRYIKHAEFSSDGASLLVTSQLGVQAWDWQAQTVRELGNGSFAAFSPDGHYIGIQFADHVRIVDAVTLQELRKVENDDKWIVQMEFSQDGQHLLTCDGSGQVRVWLVASGKQVARLLGHSASVLQASFSPSGTQIVSASHDASARVWDIESGSARTRLPGEFDVQALRIAVHPTQRQAVLNTSVEDRISGWDVKQGSLAFAIPAQLMDVDASCKHFAARNAGRISVHSCDDGSELGSFTLPANMRSQAKFSSDGQRVLIFGSQSHCWLWNWSNNHRVRIASGDEVWNTAFHPMRAEFVIGGANGKVRLLNLATGVEIAAFEHDFGTRSLTYSSDGTRLLVLSDQDQASVLKAETLELICEISREGMAFEFAKFTPDHKFVLTARLFKTGALACWDTESGKLVTSIDAPLGLCDLRVASERQALVCSNLTGVYWWDFVEGTLKQIKAGSFSLAKPIGDGGIVTATAVPGRTSNSKPKSSELEFDTPQLQVLAPNGTAWDSRSFVDVPGEVWQAIPTADESRLIVGERFYSASLYDLEERQRLGRFSGHAAPLSCVVFSTDGRIVITAALDGQILIHDAETRNLIKRLNLPSAIAAAAVSHDGSKLATVGRGGSVVVWNLQDYQAIHLEGLTATVDSCSFSAFGARLVARGTDGNWRVWDTQTGRQMHPQLTQQSVVSAQYEGDGTRILIVRRAAPFVTLVDEDGSQHDLPLDKQPNYVAFAHGDQVVTVTKDEVALWNATTAVKEQSFREDGAEFVSATPDAEGTQWLMRHGSGQLALWHREGTKMQVIASRFASRVGSPVAFSHDNKWLVIPDDARSVRAIVIDARPEVVRELFEAESKRFNVLVKD